MSEIEHKEPNGTETTVSKHRGLRPWAPGQSGNVKGRPKGARNKLGEDFIAALHDDFQANGPAAIVKVREDKPDAYLKVIASILPKEFSVNTNAFGDMSDDELGAVLASLRALADTCAAEIARAGAIEAESAEPTENLRPVH